MTLFIKVRQFKNMESDGYVLVEGSKAGLLTSQYIKSGSHSPKQAFTIMCADDDKLKFYLCKDASKYRNNEYIGLGQLNVRNLVNRNKYNLNLDNDFLMDLDLYSSQSKIVGTLNLDITYDKVSHYEGELAAGQNPIMQRVAGQKVQMFKGKCPTKNLFSLIDPAAEGQQAKFIQSIYKDGEQTLI